MVQKSKKWNQRRTDMPYRIVINNQSNIIESIENNSLCFFTDSFYKKGECHDILFENNGEIARVRH